MKKFLFLVTVLVVGSMSLMATEGALTGKFTINAQGDQVVFSQGNLQYQASTQTWRFAPQQYNYVSTTDNASISDTFDGWIDLFGWGTGLQPTLTNAAVESFVDWGVNAISNGGNQPNLWRTLTIDEWDFIINQRPKAFSLRGQISVAGTICYVLLPDNWTGGIVGYYYDFDRPDYTAAEWAELEAAGAVCIPARGYRSGTAQSAYGSTFHYWSSTEKDAGSACDVEIKRLRDSGYDNEYYIYENTGHSFDKSYGLSVRLVQEVEPDPIEIEYAEEKPLRGRFSINAQGEQIVFSQGNLQYFPQLDTFQFAANQLERSADNDYRCKYTKAWVDIFSWGMENDFILQSADQPAGADFVDFGTRAIANGGGQPNQWRTLSYDEWQYLLQGRPNADKKAGFVKVNGIVGFMLLPDIWHMPKGLTFMPSWRATYSDSYYANIYSLEDWQRMEEAGAVFLPTGRFWTSTPQDMSGSAEEDRAYVFQIDGSYYSYFGPNEHHSIIGASQVRLVQTPTLPEPEVAPISYNSERPLTGKFMVSEDKAIVFSQGNLQYNDYVQTWQFAQNQWDYLPATNNQSVSEGYAEWFDLFGWGTGNNPMLLDPDIQMYADFTDWGINPIHNGGNEPNLWFTLSKEEWDYLLQNQSHMMATVHGNKGRILLPSTFNDEPEYLDYNPQSENANILTDEQWAELEAQGAVFLPAGPGRYIDEYNLLSISTAPYIRIWTSTPYTDEYSTEQSYAYRFFAEFNYNGSPWSISTGYRPYGISVRLVQETTNTIPLDLAIIDARNAYNQLLEMAEEDNHTCYADLAAQLLIAIGSAEAVANAPDATQEEINQAKERLEEYTEHLDYAASVWMIYYEFLDYGYPEIAETFKAATDAAVATLQNEDATEEEIANAIKTIEDAYDDAYYAYQHWDVENVTAGEKAHKLLRDNMILIIRNGKTYSPTGQAIKN